MPGNVASLRLASECPLFAVTMEKVPANHPARGNPKLHSPLSTFIKKTTGFPVAFLRYPFGLARLTSYRQLSAASIRSLAFMPGWNSAMPMLKARV